MPRIIGINIPDNKQIGIALGYIYGIGRASAAKVLAQTKINPRTKAKDLTPEQMKSLEEIIKKDYRVEGRPAARRDDEHQAVEGYRVLARHAAFPQSARAGTADQDQHAHGARQCPQDRRFGQEAGCDAHIKRRASQNRDR